MQDHTAVADQWSTGLADCGDDGCTTIVPDEAFVLVRDASMPVSHADVARMLERGIAITRDRQLLIGSSHVKHVNCILDSPSVAARHARIGAAHPHTAVYTHPRNCPRRAGAWRVGQPTG